VRFAIPDNGNWRVQFRVQFLGKNRAQGYFAKNWAFVWWTDRFDDDVDWFKQRPSVPTRSGSTAMDLEAEVYQLPRSISRG
jgi:hypothetical protein